MKDIGIVGAGLMAAGMAQNFLKHGYTVHVWNRSPERLEPLIASGAKAATTPRAAAEAADIVIECVSDDEASRSVWLGDQGILAGARAGQILIASASLSLAWTDELAATCAEKGFSFLDMPLTGGRAGAESGQLKLLVGGDQAVLDSIREDLQAIAARIFYFGKSGNGMRFKLMLNTLSAIHINAAAQAAELVKKAGIDPSMFQEALFEGEMPPATGAGTLIPLRDKDKPADYVTFAVKWIEKDLRYAKAMAEQYGVTFDLLNDTQADYAQVKDAGYADQDWSKITRLYSDNESEPAQ